MFLEVTKTVFVKLKPDLDLNNIEYQISDCSIEGEKGEFGEDLEYIHLEFGNIPKKTVNFIAKLTDKYYGIVASESKETKEEGKPIAYTNENSFGFDIVIN